MTSRIRDLLTLRAAESFVGRTAELAILLGALETDGPPVVFVHGIGGIGKSSLLDVFSTQARARGATVVRLDCRAVEPTERGFLHELSSAIGSDVTTSEEAGLLVGTLGGRVVLALDNYEVFRLLDTWLRQVFIPALPDNVRIIFSGREPPVSAWLASTGWHGLFRTVSLGPLPDGDVLELLSRAMVTEDAARHINRFARGHPLALVLAASSVTEHSISELEDAAIQGVVEELSRTYLADVGDPIARKALEAVSVVRRGTKSLLGAMLSEVAPQDAYDRLQALPFVETGSDGLIVHDTVRDAIAATLKSADPTAYREYRRAAWRQLRKEVRTAGVSELWRYTADMLYIIENPVIREAFFPSGAHQFAVEPAKPEDGPAIKAICEQHEGPEAAKLLAFWWTNLPQSFYVVRDRDGAIPGFYCMFQPNNVNPRLLQEDPVVRRCLDHLRRDPVPKNQEALFIRRWLSMEYSELPSPVLAVCWLDCKRMYMELRPRLRRVYGTVCDLPTFAPILSPLGFRPIPGGEVRLDNATYHSAVLDFGPASVDGWLAGLVAAELGVEEGGILDVDSRELVLDGDRVGLTPLEFGVMHCLYQREGKTMTRVELLECVWGYEFEGASNVVEAVVRSLRKKLGERASVIQTVRGVGYRFRDS